MHQVCELEKVVELLKGKLRNLKDSRYIAQKENENLIRQSNKKILADKRLLENVQQVKVIEKQIEYTHHLIAHKRKIIRSLQNGTIQKVHKERQLRMLEEENLDMKKKMTEWLKVNQRLLNIFEEMKDREVEMIFVAERCKQRNVQLREECGQMQEHMLAISKRLDEIGMGNVSDTSSSSIILHNEANELKGK
ncbi:unnamed protein product [Litomosoides sigmodontis]|uniref:Uncharacterized protein n=1 Tax=Litomosoides sigmodontis TaxID=42156 RepID=A0A3P6TBZ6_LITSI|nr:unnamed protein product [Litomosoides sigmodontis]